MYLLNPLGLAQALERDGSPSLSSVLSNFDQMRRAVVNEGKAATAQCAAATSQKEAKEQLEIGISRVADVFEGKSEALLQLIHTAQRLRRLPCVEPSEPLVVLVGMPNVGKSSIVRTASSGTPEVNDYPFTTRRLLIGHVQQASDRYQARKAQPLEPRNPHRLSRASLECGR